MRGRLVIVVALAACGGGGASPADLAVAPPDLTPPVCRDPVPPDGGAAPTFANVQRIFAESCESCHCCNGEVDFAPAAAWANLVGKGAPTAGDACGGPLVTPGDPAASYLYVKLSSDTPCFGARMPQSELGPMPLPACQVDLVRRWILAGAPDN